MNDTIILIKKKLRMKNRYHDVNAIQEKEAAK